MSDMSLPTAPPAETAAASAPQLTVMTVNIHKGFTTFNRRFILPELRDAVRKVGADVVFMQEVLGMHDEHGKKIEDWPEAAGPYEFLADSIWPQYAYGRNMVYPKGHHGNAIMSKFETAISPMTVHIGFTADLDLPGFLEQAELNPVSIEKVNVPKIWTLITVVKD